MDFLLPIIFVVGGILAGTFTGLIPGIHVNLIASFVLLISFHLRDSLPLSLLVIFIIAMSITHTFIDFLPSILIGVPDAETALSVLPAHRLVLEGRAYHAITLSALGSLGGLGIAFLIGIPLFFFLPLIYDHLTFLIPWLLGGTVIALILLEPSAKQRWMALVIVCLAGSWGMLVLQTALVDRPLLVLFTGIFGMSAILVSLKERNSELPAQTIDTDFRFSLRFLRNLGIGGIASTICSISPGLGNAQAGTLSSLCFRDSSTDDLLVVLSAINTITFLLSFLTFYLIDKTRTGTVAAISQITPELGLKEMFFYAGIGLGVGMVACVLTLFLGKYLLFAFQKLSLTLLNSTILLFLSLLIPFLSNLYGFAICLGSAALGVYCLLNEIRRVHLMAVLIVPVIGYFL